MLSASDLIRFEQQVAQLFQAKEIRGPVHLSGGNEESLIEVFRLIPKNHWVFSSWRWHYHALLHGISPAEIIHHLRTKNTMNACFQDAHFYTSAMAGGILPIACGVAAGLRGGHVHCFVGDMTAEMGIFHEVSKYAAGHTLPLTLYVENNSFSTDTPTEAVWPQGHTTKYLRYSYSRTWPHMQKSPFGGPK